MRSAPAARQLHSVVERRVNAGLPVTIGNPPEPAAPRRAGNTAPAEETPQRPLEDPYLVGERAAAEAKRERLARERADILLREDEHLLWLFSTYYLAMPGYQLHCKLMRTLLIVVCAHPLEQMPGQQERERSWSNFRREMEFRQRRSTLQRLGSRLI